MRNFLTFLRAPCEKLVEFQLFKTADLIDLPEIPDGVVVRLIKSGDLRTNGKSIVKHNALVIEKAYPEGSGVNEIINDFIGNYLNQDLCKTLISKLEPEQSFLRVHIPAKSSTLVQDDFIEQSTLQTMINIGLDLDFWFT